MQSRTLRKRRFRNVMVVAAMLAAATATARAQVLPRNFKAEYLAYYKEREVGTAVFTLNFDSASGTYTYESHTTVKGILSLLSPRPIVDRSRFRVDDGHITPIKFSHEDGSRNGEENQQILFDWSAGVAELSGEFGTIEVELQPGTLDRASLQIALMNALLNGRQPQQYTIADDQSVKTYSYSPLGTKEISTELGTLSVVSFTQQRDGSSRHTIIDFSPKHDFVPVRIEQFRESESRSTFVLKSLTIE